MTTEEKLQHFLDTCMEDARVRSGRMLDEYMTALEKTFEEHKADTRRREKLQLSQETEKIEREINKQLAVGQIEIRRTLGMKQEELKDKLFVELRDMLANYLETQEGRNLPVVHCVKNTPGWELNEKVAAALGDAKVIDKPTFGSRTLAEELEAIAAKEEIEVTLVGLCTDICVVSNALLIKAYLPEIQVKVIASCCAGVTPASHEAALTTMQMCQIKIENN